MWLLFADVGTQWRVGMGGATGLDYGPLFEVMRRQGLEGEAWREAFDDIRTLEAAALKAMHAPT